MVTLQLHYDLSISHTLFSLISCLFYRFPWSKKVFIWQFKHEITTNWPLSV